MLLRLSLGLVAWLVLGTVTHAKEYERGGYRFEVAPAASWVTVRKVADRWPADAPGASGARWRYWLMDSQIDRRHGHRDRYIDRVYEPVTQELVRDAGKYEIGFDPSYETLTIHEVAVRRDGVWQQRLDPASITLARRESSFDVSDMATGQVSALIVLNDIRAGDLVRIRYTLGGSNPILAGMEAEKFEVDWFRPILERHIRVWWDKGVPMDVRTSSGLQAPAPSVQADGQLVALDRSALAAVYDEGSYPREYSPVAWLNVAARRTWGDVAAWARGLYPAPKPLPADLRERIAVWRALPDVDSRIAAALRAVQEEVRYFGVELGESSHRPSEPADTWQRRYGDCKDKARLLATILRQMDIEAYPALVSTQDGRALHGWPPSPSAFDHVIVQVRLPGATLWLDATQTQQRDPVRALSRDVLGTALPIAPDSNELVDIQRQPEAIDRVHVEERFSPQPDGRSVLLQITSQYRGTVAERMRQQFQSQSPADLARAYADYYRGRFGDVQGDPPSVQDDPRTGLLTVTEHYRLADPWVGHEGHLIDLYAESIGSLMTTPRVASRSAPYALGVPVEAEHTVYFDVPSGWTAAVSPETSHFDDAAMQYDHSLVVAAKQIQVIDRYRGHAEEVPAADFPSYFATVRKAHDDLFTRLSFGVAGDHGDRDARNKRLQDLLRGVMENGDGNDKE